MNKEQFEQNLKQIIAIYKEKQLELRSLSQWVHTAGKEQNILIDFLDNIGIEKTEETLYAAYMRLSSLKEEALTLAIEKQWFTEQEEQNLLEKAFLYVANYHYKSQQEILSQIEKQNLLSDFYLAVWKGVFSIAQSFNDWFPDWQRKIIFENNKTLEKEFHSDGDKIMQFLESENLFDTGYNPEGRADRSYSILVKTSEGKYVSKAYREAFPEVMESIISKLDTLIQTLSQKEDEVYGQKDAYINYFTALKNAFAEVETSKLVPLWGEVDKAWMQITTPLQPAHPLEYYEDLYRNAVSPEWDLRVRDDSILTSEVYHDIEQMYEKMFTDEEKVKYQESYEFSRKSIDQVQLYIGWPIIYSWSEFNGLYSAQVVPNDGVVSSLYGKKIFASPWFVLNMKRTQPQMKINEVVFEKSFVEDYYSYLHGDENVFYKVYDIETLGHEYGHTLWLYPDSEEVMNSSGLFKKIEEWKATAGGFVAFFLFWDISFQKEFFLDHIFRTVGLMKFREVEEILPYYCEGLVHLEILFASGMLAYKNEKIVFNYEEETVQKVKEIYMSAYKNQRQIYLDKRDAGEFLYQYVLREKGVFLPKTPLVRDFVESYYALYKSIGNETIQK